MGKTSYYRRVVDPQGLSAENASATSDAQPRDDLGRALRGLTPLRGASVDDEPVGARADACRDTVATAPEAGEELKRSADRHEREARLHDRLAAEASGYLRLGFLHAAEAHRAAAWRARA
jgi:hypothetical protein